MTNTKMTEAKRVELVAVANAQNAQWPQYRGMFEGYRIGRVTRTVKTKLGLAFEKGEIVIWNCESRDIGRGPEVSFVAYSVRNRCNTGLPRTMLEVA